ncbi:MAG: hypothetical protein ACREQ9_02920 [Candidatus Binatia bacterium]
MTTPTAIRRIRRKLGELVWRFRLRSRPLRTDPRLGMETLVRWLATPGATYSFEEIRRIRESCLARDRRPPDRRQSGSTRVEDGTFLYLLVRKLRPRTIFEVGTLIGTSASTMALAQAENGEGGVVCTVDGSYGGFEPLPGQAIRCFPGQRSHVALETMRVENRRIDLLFVDGTIGRADVEVLNEVRSPELVVALHDYKPPLDKGLRNAWLLSRHFEGAAGAVWVLPERQGRGYPLDGDLFVNSSIAVLLPEPVAERIVRSR